MKVNIFNFKKSPRVSFTKKDVVFGLESVFKEALSINVVFVDVQEIKRLNEEFRGVDEVTDVLSFGPYGDLGEVYIYSEFFESHEEFFSEQVIRTVIHGILHICGYDHEGYCDENNDKEEMYILQEEYLKRFYDILGRNNI